MNTKTVLVTGANGYIGNAVAKAFSRAGWKTFGLVRREDAAADLARNEIHPIIGSPEDLSFLEQTRGVVFDVIVSNTEDTRNPGAHFEKVQVMLHEITRHSQQADVRPLVMFTSGCKDYGLMNKKHGDPGLAPHTEQSPMNPPVQLAPRKDFGISLLEDVDGYFDSIVLRPTIVYGLSSSHYGSLFDLASKSGSVLKLIADPSAIMHSLHVDDCAEAYVTLAEFPKREEIVKQAFNISNRNYETAQQIGDALANSYNLDLEFIAPPENMPMDSVHALANFWQWVGSDKIRDVTGWRERRQTFVEGIEEYRMAYEATMIATTH
jgi:nucleoside-diphosphate-sugar epimerase